MTYQIVLCKLFLFTARCLCIKVSLVWISSWNWITPVVSFSLWVSSFGLKKMNCTVLAKIEILTSLESLEDILLVLIVSHIITSKYKLLPSIVSVLFQHVITSLNILVDDNVLFTFTYNLNIWKYDTKILKFYHFWLLKFSLK